MRFFSRVFAALVLAIASFGTASAATIFDEVSISYLSNTSFTLFDLSFSSPLTSNVFASSPFASPGGALVVANTSIIPLVSVDALLNTAQPFTFSFKVQPTGGVLSSFNETLNVVPGATQGIGGTSFNGSIFYAVNVAVSPVPLPASLPLFALAVICLAGLAYAGRKKANSVIQIGSPSVEATSAS
jgi:hypothetical protein